MRKLLWILLFTLLIIILLNSTSIIDISAASTTISRPEISLEYNGNSVKINWEKIDGYEIYSLYRSKEYTGSYELMKDTNSMHYTDKQVLSGNAYFYKLMAKNKYGKKSKFSNIKQVYISSKYIPVPVSSKNIVSEKDSIIIVSTNSINTTYANLSFYKKRNGKFNLEFSTLGYIGKNGLSKSKEGDGRTPIGTYHFSNAFGTKPAPKGTIISYIKVNSTHWVVSDSESKYYNSFVSTKNVKKDWEDSYGEQLYHYSEPYSYALFIDYNKEAVKNKGSAIFLHCYSNRKYTAGCVAIPKEKMEYIMKNLAADENTISSEIVIKTYNNITKLAHNTSWE